MDLPAHTISSHSMIVSILSWTITRYGLRLVSELGVDYRKNIFLFLSSTGGKEITQTALDSWNRGKEREQISVSKLLVCHEVFSDTFDTFAVAAGAFNEDGGVQ